MIWKIGNNADAVGKSCLLNCLSTFVPFLGQFCVASVRRDVREKQRIEVSHNFYRASY